MSEEYPESVLTENRSGETEVRTLSARGEFIICEYSDPEKLERKEDKRKLILKDQDGNFEEYFIIPLKEENKNLLISPSEESREYYFWNKERSEVEKF